MKKTTSVFLLAGSLLFFGCSTTRISEQPKLGWEYFPERPELPHDSSFAADPTCQLPHIKYSINPVLPNDLESGNYTAEVTFIIETDESIKQAVVSKSSGNRGIDQVCLETIKKWKYTATIIKGNAVATVGQQRFTFKIE